MQTQSTGSRRASSIAVVMSLAPLCAHAADWNALRIDGSSVASFEASVASLQSELPPGRRADFEVALVVIWLSHAAQSLDVDGNGEVDLRDIDVLTADAVRLLSAARRGDLVSAIEKREKSQTAYTVTDYFQQLDRLGYNDVLGLAARPSKVPYLAVLRRYDLDTLCGRSVDRPNKLCVIDAPTGKGLNAAIGAFNAKQYADARTAIGKLDLDRMTPFGRSKTEQILFLISYAEGKLAEAREHLETALAAGGLNAQEVLTAVNQIRQVDSLLSRSIQ